MAGRGFGRGVQGELFSLSKSKRGALLSRSKDFAEDIKSMEHSSSNVEERELSSTFVNVGQVQEEAQGASKGLSKKMKKKLKKARRQEASVLAEASGSSKPQEESGTTPLKAVRTRTEDEHFFANSNSNATLEARL